MPAQLAEITTPADLKRVYTECTRLPEDVALRSAVLNLLQLPTVCRSSTVNIRIFAFPDNEPAYYFALEAHSDEFSLVHARTPTEHKEALLESAIRALLLAIRPFVLEHGIEVLSDDVIGEVFTRVCCSVIPEFIVGWCDPMHSFYMNSEQMEKLTKTELRAPDGCYIDDKVSVVREAEVSAIYEAWEYGTTIELAKTYLSSLPSVLVRSLADDRLIAWELTNFSGELCHLFTEEQHRGRGIGLFVELALAKKLATAGLPIVKWVASSNKRVVAATRAHSLWREWRGIHSTTAASDASAGSAPDEDRKLSAGPLCSYRYFHPVDRPPCFNFMKKDSNGVCF